MTSDCKHRKPRPKRRMMRLVLAVSLATVPVLSASASTSLEALAWSHASNDSPSSSYRSLVSASTTVQGDWGGIESIDIPVTDSPNADANQTSQPSQAPDGDQGLSTSGKTTGQETTPAQAPATTPSDQPVQLRSLLPASVLDGKNDHVWVDVDSTIQIDGERGTIVRWALSQVGYHPYVFGGADIDNGIDCSGFVMRAYEQARLSIPHGSRELSTMGREVSLSDAEPGDVVAYAGHAALYVGDGMIVHMIQSEGHEDGVYLTPLSDSWMGNSSWSIRRLLD